MRWLFEFLRDEDGPTAVEYAVMLALIIMACIGVIGTIGVQTKELMDPDGSLSGAMSDANGG